MVNVLDPTSADVIPDMLERPAIKVGNRLTQMNSQKPPLFLPHVNVLGSQAKPVFHGYCF